MSEEPDERGKRLPEHPTTCLPGTPEKVEVMRLRYERGEHLHHQADAKRSLESKGERWVA